MRFTVKRRQKIFGGIHQYKKVLNLYNVKFDVNLAIIEIKDCEDLVRFQNLIGMPVEIDGCNITIMD